VIVKINDVGPLTPGRIIDLNERTMRHFDPSLQRGVINGVRVKPLAGDYWIPGPVG
jgi:rare lipoprotein A